MIAWRGDLYSCSITLILSFNDVRLCQVSSRGCSVTGQVGAPLGQGVLAGCAVLSTGGLWVAPISKLK